MTSHTVAGKTPQDGKVPVWYRPSPGRVVWYQMVPVPYLSRARPGHIYYIIFLHFLRRYAPAWTCGEVWRRVSVACVGTLYLLQSYYFSLKSLSMDSVHRFRVDCCHNRVVESGRAVGMLWHVAALVGVAPGTQFEPN